ncbi:caspase-8-like [Glandiceps talaboti]
MKSLHVSLKTIRKAAHEFSRNNSTFNLVELVYNIFEMAVNISGYSGTEMPRIPEYRSLLYKISVQLDKENIKHILFLLYSGCERDSAFNREDYYNIKEAQDLFIEMEYRGFLSEDNLLTLRSLLDNIDRKDLVEKINSYIANGRLKCH